MIGAVGWAPSKGQHQTYVILFPSAEGEMQGCTITEKEEASSTCFVHFVHLHKQLLSQGVIGYLLTTQEAGVLPASFREACVQTPDVGQYLLPGGETEAKNFQEA